jgi:hypothetical protein
MGVWWISLWIVSGSLLLLILAGILAYLKHERERRFRQQRYKPINEPNTYPKNGRILLEKDVTIHYDYDDHRNNGVLTVIEYAPQRRSINVNGEWHTLQFPYIIFVLVKKKRTIRDAARVYTFIGFAKKPVTGDDTKIWFPPLPHVYNQYNICLGCSPTTNEIAIEKFWNTSFHDASFEQWQDGNRLGYHGTKLCYKHFGGFEKWSELGLRKVKKKLSWAPAPYSTFLARCTESLRSDLY